MPDPIDKMSYDFRLRLECTGHAKKETLQLGMTYNCTPTARLGAGKTARAGLPSPTKIEQGVSRIKAV